MFARIPSTIPSRSISTVQPFILVVADEHSPEPVVPTGGSTVQPFILVVAVDEAEADKILRALASEGYVGRWENNSVDGLIVVEDEHPAAVILDWNMPYIDGTIFTLALHAGLAAPPPVVALVGPGVDMGQVQAAGASAWVPSPSDPDLLTDLLGTLLSAQ
jgi:DNA-binding response OmpR family regulator